MQQSLGFIYVLLAGIGFGFLGIFGRLAFQSGLGVGELLTFRFALASLLLLLGLLIFKPKLLKLPLKQILISVALGVLGYAVFSTLYFKAIEGISIPLAALLLFTFPIFVNLGSHFILKNKMTEAETMSLAIACIGLVVLLWGPIIVDSLPAVAFALLAAINYSIYILASGKYQKNVPPLSASLYIIISATFTLYFFHQPPLAKIAELSLPQILIILGIAVVCTIAPLTLFLAGLQKLSSAQASIIVMIEPVVATLAAWFLLNEQLSPQQLSGAGLVIFALILNARK